MPIPHKEKIEAPKSAKIRIYEALKEWIVDGTLQPGEKIVDTEISDYFSVSRTPVREAMQLLADQKLIEIIPGKESRVTQLDVINIKQIYRMLAELHALAVEFAFEKIDEKIISKLEKLNQAFAECIARRDYKASMSCDQAFHDLFFQLAGNEFLTSFSHTLNTHVLRLEKQYHEVASNIKDSVEEHRQVIEAVRAHNLERAKKAMAYNWLHTAEIIRVG